MKHILLKLKTKRLAGAQLPSHGSAPGDPLRDDRL